MCNDLAIYNGSDTNTSLGGAFEQWSLDLCRSSYLHRRTGNTASQRQVSSLCRSRSYQLRCNRKQGESIVFVCEIGSHYAHLGATQERDWGFSGDRICIIDTNNFFSPCQKPFSTLFQYGNDDHHIQLYSSVLLWPPHASWFGGIKAASKLAAILIGSDVMSVAIFFFETLVIRVVCKL